MPDGLTAHLSGLVSLQGRLRGLAQRVMTEGAAVVQQTTQDVWTTTVRTSPVDTGALRRSWTPPAHRGGPLLWGFGTDRHYAPTLEYGGYSKVGPRTIHLGGGHLGAGFVAGAGIYSTQAPLGFVRKALAQVCPAFREAMRVVVRTAWDSGTVAVHFPPATTPATPLGVPDAPGVGASAGQVSRDVLGEAVRRLERLRR